MSIGFSVCWCLRGWLARATTASAKSLRYILYTRASTSTLLVCFGHFFYYIILYYIILLTIVSVCLDLTCNRFQKMIASIILLTSIDRLFYCVVRDVVCSRVIINWFVWFFFGHFFLCVRLFFARCVPSFLFLFFLFLSRAFFLFPLFSRRWTPTPFSPTVPWVCLQTGPWLGPHA